MLKTCNALSHTAQGMQHVQHKYNIPALCPACKLENHDIHSEVDSGEGTYIHEQRTVTYVAVSQTGCNRIIMVQHPAMNCTYSKI
jgi:hypothetical protein